MELRHTHAMQHWCPSACCQPPPPISLSIQLIQNLMRQTRDKEDKDGDEENMGDVGGGDGLHDRGGGEDDNPSVC